MSQELQDLQVALDTERAQHAMTARVLQEALDTERAQHAMTTQMLDTVRASLVSETVAHTNTRASLTTAQANLTFQKITAEEVERFEARATTHLNCIIKLLRQIRDLKHALAATQAALTVAEEARHEAQEFAMQF